MKRTMCRCTYFTAVIITALLFCMAIIATSPLLAATDPTEKQIAATGYIGARISELHTKLQITPAQEDQWKKVADAMRENATTMETLIQARKDKMGTMNAVDNLKSYRDVSDTHTAALTKFITVFEPLYASMSPDQKKIADGIFSHVGEHKGHRHHKGSKK